VAHLCAKLVLSSRISSHFDVVPDFFTRAIQSDVDSMPD
jgi:hypothetical protein